MLDAQQRAYDGTPAPAPDPDLATQEFLIAHYEWRHAEIPDESPPLDAPLAATEGTPNDEW